MGDGDDNDVCLRGGADTSGQHVSGARPRYHGRETRQDTGFQRLSLSGGRGSCDDGRRKHTVCDLNRC